MVPAATALVIVPAGLALRKQMYVSELTEPMRLQAACRQAYNLIRRYQSDGYDLLDCTNGDIAPLLARIATQTAMPDEAQQEDEDEAERQDEEEGADGEPSF